LTPKEADALKTLIRSHRWALEELVMDQKMQEVNGLFNGAPKGMIAYLVSKFGSVRSVILNAKDLIRWQRGRAKTLNMETLVDHVRKPSDGK